MSSARFSSTWGLLLSVLGIAIGTGNIWRFPRIAAKNGGDEGAGAFLIAWLVCLVLWSIPLIIAEYALGRSARAGVIRSFVYHGGPGWAWIGGFVALVATSIMFYYSVVTGWCVYYAGYMAMQPLPATTEAAFSVWETFHAQGLAVVFHGFAMGIGALVVARGVQLIERLNKILIPSLLVIVLICLVRSLTLPGAWSGVDYLFTVKWSQLLSVTVWLEALTQNAWDTGAGWGMIIVYAAYMSARGGIVKYSVITATTNNLVSLMAALVVFGTVFALLGRDMSHADILKVMKDSGPASTGLTFIWMPQLFARMTFGGVLCFLFFLGLSFAAFSSLISMIELAARVLVDFGVRRRTAAIAVGAVGFLLGLPSALSLDFLSNQDFVWGVGLILSGLFVAAVCTKWGTARFIDDFRNSSDDWNVGRAWTVVISVVIPLLAIVLLFWWLYLSFSVFAPDRWWDPTVPFSVGACLLYWGFGMGILLLLNRRFVTWLESNRET